MLRKSTRKVPVWYPQTPPQMSAQHTPKHQPRFFPIFSAHTYSTPQQRQHTYSTATTRIPFKYCRSTMHVPNHVHMFMSMCACSSLHTYASTCMQPTYRSWTMAEIQWTNIIPINLQHLFVCASFPYIQPDDPDEKPVLNRHPVFFSPPFFSV